MKNAAFANLARYRKFSAHQTNKFATDGQAQSCTGPRLLPGLGLFEVTEQLVLVVGRNARARVLDPDEQAGIAPSPDTSFLAAHLANPVLQIDDARIKAERGPALATALEHVDVDLPARLVFLGPLLLQDGQNLPHSL